MSKTVLSIGSEGGSISLYYNNGYFSGSTNETASLDMLDEEDQKEIMEILANRPPEPEFKTFREAFEHLHTKYRIFCFIPVYIDPEYFNTVMQLLEEAKKKMSGIITTLINLKDGKTTRIGRSVRL